VVSSPVIHHWTPLTPRAALLDVCKSRAMCVSFYRPDDVEAVEAISPAVMFRQRRVFLLESGAAFRPAVGGKMGLATVLRVAGTAPVSSGAVGGDPRYAGGTFPAQRRPTSAMAVRAKGRATLAYGWAYRAPTAALRSIRPGVSRMDRRRQDVGQPRVSRAHGGGGPGIRQPLASDPHDARHCGCADVPICQRGQHLSSTERMAL